MSTRLLALLCAVSFSCATDAPLNPPIALIPQPHHVTTVAGPPLSLTSTTVISAPKNAEVVAQYLSKNITTFTGVTCAVSTENSTGISLVLNPNLEANGPEWAQAEAYRIDVSSSGATITARTEHGLFNGAQTLAQLATSIDQHWIIPAVTIIDQPRFRWRGVMLDCARHFFSVPEVYRFIDLMALHKFNTLQWHLTDDQGWRIDVHCHPKLTSVGAWRAESPTMKDRNTGDGIPYGGFYTHDDIRAVVAYAAARFITIVPEFELPGHSTATIAAYPELGNNDAPGWTAPTTGTKWGVIARTLAPKEETFQFFAQLFDEILPLFPGAYIHIGGDEAPKDEWKNSPFAQSVIKAQGLADEHALQSYFIRRIEKLLTERGKRLIGWDEIQEGGLSPTATMMVWRDWKWAKLALSHGNDVVMAPTSHTYFDYGQGKSAIDKKVPVIGGVLPLEKVYSFEPVPAGTPSDQLVHLLGCQCQMWSEYIWSLPKAEYMVWPRACAIAEIAWSPATNKNYTEFKQRLSVHEGRLDRMTVNYRRDDGLPAQPTQSMNRTPRPVK